MDREELLRKYSGGEKDFTGQVLFYNVNLIGAIFKNAILSETGFCNANLSKVDFRGAKRFNEVTFDKVIFYETIIPDGSIRTDNV